VKPQTEIFESEEATALICESDEKLQSVVAEQIRSLGLKTQLGLFREDVAVRLQTNAYDVLIVSEGFENVEGEWNPIIMDCCDLSPAHRRSIFIVLTGPEFKTEDGVQAFQRSVDLVVSTADLGRLGGILRRGLDDHKLRYRPFQECAEGTSTA
jgi:hypothetical protein